MCNSKDENETKIIHYEKIKEDVRDEIKIRIKQRDSFFIQFLVFIAAVLTIAFYKDGDIRALAIIPLISIFYSVLILYSYHIHHIITEYLRKEIEKKLAELCNTDAELEWERYYKSKNVPGIRKSFFIVVLWVMTILPIGYLVYFTNSCYERLIFGIVGLVYIGIAFFITIYFKNK